MRAGQGLRLWNVFPLDIMLSSDFALFLLGLGTGPFHWLLKCLLLLNRRCSLHLHWLALRRWQLVDQCFGK